MHDDEDDRPSNFPEEGSSRTGLTLSPEVRLDRAMQKQIGVELRKLYEDALNQPLPERLLALLEPLEKRH